MDFEQALRAELSAITGLNGKIYPLNVPEGTKAPYLVYVSSYGIEYKCLDGYLETKEVPCELNVMHSSYSGMKLLSTSVISRIKSFQERVIGIDGPYIQDVSYEEPVEIYEHQVNLYRTIIGIKVKF